MLDRVVGQGRARAVLEASLAAPVHAYLFVGPTGSGKREAARAFAAALVCPDGGCGSCASCHDVLAGRHPDVVVVERQGASISVDEARQVTSLAQRSPRHGGRQVVILADFHLVDEAAPALLKTIEEPPASTVFVILADALPPGLVTIASRCLRVEFRGLDEETLAALLVAEGSDPAAAATAAAAAGGRIDRARLLANDPGFAARQERWRTVPERLDGTGMTVAVLTEELLGSADELVVVVKARQEAELKDLAAAAERAGDRGVPGRQAIEDRHRREQRRVRTDELRAGLGTLVSAYRSQLRGSEPARETAALLACCGAIDTAAELLERNPNETLLLQSLLLALDAARR
ncbi:MAG: DNA polymerase III subunit delta' [Actinomycetota bacterium]|nr:DNA polymerase III subunit delta' [Actinomycetota bacterium]